MGFVRFLRKPSTLPVLADWVLICRLLGNVNILLSFFVIK
ncbi:hypothetical protein SAMN05216428_11712 [Nitrosospira sp. Nsp11]|nr:hypothetical protein SAMN05216428_11712 [Nitrosospira sp. Nsp11]